MARKKRPPLTLDEKKDRALVAAGALLARLDTITSGEFAMGGEQNERRALRAALADLYGGGRDAAG